MRQSTRPAIISLCLGLILVSGAQAQSPFNVSSISATDSLSAVQGQAGRTLSGVIITRRKELVPNVNLVVQSASGEQQTISDAEGNFRLSVPLEALTLKVSGKNIAPYTLTIGPREPSEDLRIEIDFVIPQIHTLIS